MFLILNFPFLMIFEATSSVLVSSQSLDAFGFGCIFVGFTAIFVSCLQPSHLFFVFPLEFPQRVC